jgi:hypothetical protein
MAAHLIGPLPKGSPLGGRPSPLMGPKGPMRLGTQGLVFWGALVLTPTPLVAGLLPLAAALVAFVEG